MANNPYFASRVEAGKSLAERLSDISNTDVTVLAVSEGSVIVAAQIASKLHCLITLIMTKAIGLPDGLTTIGTIADSGKFTINKSISIGALEDLMIEYQGTIELSKLAALHDMHVLGGKNNLLDKKFFRNKTVIVVSDGVKHGNLFQAAADYLHDIKIKKLILATPICSVEAVDRLHIIADRLEIIRAVPMFFTTSHYYANNNLPSNEKILDYIENIVNNWPVV
ncbi:hypothetical protein KC878_01915 [Candidatus Saccharibacteria bacterium]|nr:hypothetical protein [Candidatus Saccharibacteria bacterium]MCB9821521.1 hypothetical protein [Candidatus Nomurabacteria bacterium]